MASYEVFENKLLERFLDELVFIDLKPEKKWGIHDMVWPNEVPIPIFTSDLAAHIKENDIEKIPMLALLKGFVYYVGAEGDAQKVQSPYVEFLNTMDPEFYASVLIDGIKLAENEAFVEAILYLRAVTRLKPDNIDAWYNKARCYYDIGVLKENKAFNKMAMHDFEKVSAYTTEISEVYYYLGFCYYADAQYAKAYETWKLGLRGNLSIDAKEEIIVAISKIEDQVQYEKGVKLILEGRNDEGLEILKVLEETHDEWWELVFFIGVGLRMQDLYEDAIGYFLKVLTLNTGHIQAMNELGMCFLAVGDIDAAKKHYKEALRLSPKNPELICNMGIVYLNEGNLLDAQANFEKAYELSPDDEVIKMWLSHVNEKILQ